MKIIDRINKEKIQNSTFNYLEKGEFFVKENIKDNNNVFFILFRC